MPTRETDRSEAVADLPKRVIVDQHGHYWRDYGDALSMCPVSDENNETEVVAVYVRDEIGGMTIAQLRELVADVETARAALRPEKEEAGLREALHELEDIINDHGGPGPFIAPSDWRVERAPLLRWLDKRLAALAAPSEEVPDDPRD